MSYILTAALNIGFFGIILQRQDLIRVALVLIGIASIRALIRIFRGRV